MSRLQVVVLGGGGHSQPSQESVLANVLGKPGVDVGWMTHQQLMDDTPERRLWTESVGRVLVFGWEGCEAMIARLSRNEIFGPNDADGLIAAWSSMFASSREPSVDDSIASRIGQARFWYVDVRDGASPSDVVDEALAAHRRISAEGVRLFGGPSSGALGLPVVDVQKPSRGDDVLSGRVLQSTKTEREDSTHHRCGRRTSESEMDAWIDQLDQHFDDPDR